MGLLAPIAGIIFFSFELDLICIHQSNAYLSEPKLPSKIKFWRREKTKENEFESSNKTDSKDHKDPLSDVEFLRYTIKDIRVSNCQWSFKMNQIFEIKISPVVKKLIERKCEIRNEAKRHGEL